MTTTNPEDKATENLAIAKSSVAISSAHHDNDRDDDDDNDDDDDDDNDVVMVVVGEKAGDGEALELPLACDL